MATDAAHINKGQQDQGAVSFRAETAGALASSPAERPRNLPVPGPIRRGEHDNDWVALGIASGQPGAGRSTLGANLAVAMAEAGLRVGLTDTETEFAIIPPLLGAVAPRREGSALIPEERFGVQLMSFAWLGHAKDEADGMGRRPSLSESARAFRESVAWRELDLLLIEMPEDVAESALLCESLGVDGIVIVATPQGAEAGATKRAVTAFRNAGWPVVGLIENKSYYRCRQCGLRQPAHASGAVAVLAQQLGVPYLGEVPISIALRDCMDNGRPICGCEPDLPETEQIHRVAARLRKVCWDEQLADTAGKKL